MPQINVSVKKLDERAQLPVHHHEGDAGADLVILDDVLIPPQTTVDIPTGIAITVPHDYYVRIVGRSSTLRKRGLMVNEGIIDQGYRGHLFFAVYNPSQESVLVKAGERLAQMIVGERFYPNFVETARLSPTSRGEDGFGSTGV